MACELTELQGSAGLVGDHLVGRVFVVVDLDDGLGAVEQADRLIGMAWEDRTPFEAIEVQFGLKENEVRALMRRHLKPGSFRRWRTRVKGRSTKHARLRGFSTGRFRSASQRRS